MKRLFGFLVVVGIAWYGWKNYGNLRSAPMNEVVIENDAGFTLGRVRVSINGTEYPAYDSLYSGRHVTQKFPAPGADGGFELHWATQGKGYDAQWTGGHVTAGPVLMRHLLQIEPDGGVVWSSSPIPVKS
jgi:hypothetical protein